jgi:two-component system OmpR family sensor kinase
MFNTLYRKMAAILFGLVLLLGLIFIQLVSYSSSMYQQEVAQKLNTTLAEHIIQEESLLSKQKVNHATLKRLFHTLMVINPSIELYLLDTEGNILSYSAPPGRVKRDKVDLKPIKHFLQGEDSYPLLGDDPRALDREKVFSAAVIPGVSGPEGYLYIILGSEAFDSVTGQIKDSYILQFTITILLLALTFAWIFGVFGFAQLTKRLRHLAGIMINFRNQSHPISDRYPLDSRPSDEIDELGKCFNQMADRINQQVETLQKNDAKRRELIANVSHDLRTPLTSLHGYIETLLLKDTELSNEERRNYLNIANKQSKQLSHLVSELFELAKLDSCETLINVEPFSLAELMQDVVQKFQLDAELRGIQLKMDYGGNVPFAYGDIGLMQRVLNNLMENALRYTPAGGQITLSLAASPDKITVKVADTGKGIPSDELPHIFDRFYRLEKCRSSEALNAGLGLAIAKRILDLHGSTIRAQSEPEKGTVFTFQMAAYQTA